MREIAPLVDAPNLPLADASKAVAPTEIGQNTAADEGFKVFVLGDLDAVRIEIFAKFHGIDETQRLLEEIERRDAQSYTTRPQDLDELLEFWRSKKRIGTRFELMHSSVERRLRERDQKRASLQHITPEKIREGARTLAAGITLTQISTIRVPDGEKNQAGLSAAELLPTWKSSEIDALLDRPIFDEAIYGTVRFHHRSVREYLAAEWFVELLRTQTARYRIETLFFKDQFGVPVIVPALRPLLPWMALFDQKVLERLRAHHPEVLLEGGDPAQLRLDVRQSVLRSVCQIVANREDHSGMVDIHAAQRFANDDLEEDVRSHLITYASNNDVLDFLLRMIWRGAIKGLAAEAKTIALRTDVSDYTRIAAIRALAATRPGELDAVRASFDTFPIDRSILAQLVETLPLDEANWTWLEMALRNAAPKEKFTVDRLASAVERYVNEVDLATLPLVVAGLRMILATPPFIEHRFCNVSSKHRWLFKAAMNGVQRLLQAHDVAALDEPTLHILHMRSTSRDYEDLDVRDERALAPLVQASSEVNRALFWYEVDAAKDSPFATLGEAIIDLHQVSRFGRLWHFEESDFPYAIEQMSTQTDPDKTQLAFALAFELYAKAGRKSRMLTILRKAATADAKLGARLNLLLKPPPLSRPAKRWREEEAKYKRRAREQKRKEEQESRKAKIFLQRHIEEIRDPCFPNPSDFSRSQYYLLDKMRQNADRESRWTNENWQALIPEFGEEIARAFRDGALTYWRRLKPVTRSEGHPFNSTPNGVIFGLTGLAIEAAETQAWPTGFTSAEAELACRYASFELNGFPSWFGRLFKAYPVVSTAFLMHEIRFELDREVAGAESHYILSDVSWSAAWTWDYLAPGLFRWLENENPLNLSTLFKMLKVLQGSNLDGFAIAKLAKLKVVDPVVPEDQKAAWFAVWTELSPDEAIAALEQKLESLANDTESVAAFAMGYITSLNGGRDSENMEVRAGYRTPEALKRLHLLMCHAINRKNDIERVGKGVYSPVTRDHAQRARDRLYEMIQQTPGKEAYLAMAEIAATHPDMSARPWLSVRAKAKAAAESELAPWQAKQVQEFAQQMERTPANYRELAELVSWRVHDLKYDLEDGDSSDAAVLIDVEHETKMRISLGNVLQRSADGRYNVVQEEELADAKCPDFRFHGNGFAAPVPLELKLADNWDGEKLFERLENQLCRGYLRDIRSVRGFFVLIYRGDRRTWRTPAGKVLDFNGLVTALQEHWTERAPHFPSIEEIAVIGIDLTRRGVRTKPIKDRLVGDKVQAKRRNKTKQKQSKKKIANKSAKK